MKRITELVAVIIVIAVAYVSASAATRQLTVEFSVGDVTHIRTDGFDILYLPQCDITDRVGYPQLPVKTIQWAVPAGARVEDVAVTGVESEYLPGVYNLFPCQPPRILSAGRDGIAFVPPDPAAYSAAGFYPESVIASVPAGRLRDTRLSAFQVYPLQYEAQTGRVRILTRIDISITLADTDAPPARVAKASLGGSDIQNRILRATVANSRGVLPSVQTAQSAPQTAQAGEVYEYVIITSSALESAFTPLAAWKTQKGVPAKIVTTQQIYAEYTGADNAEQIRNFIQTAYADWGTVWVLLGGDTPIVPQRVAWAMDCEYGSTDHNYIPADLYYSDLDGDWDANGNGVYGEVDDNVDLYPDVFVGRACCDNLSEAEAWVSKLLVYEQAPPTDYQLNMAFFAEILWSSPYTDSSVPKNVIDSLCVPPRYDPITKLYESLGNESQTTVVQALNDGQSIVNHNGHCWIDLMGVGSGYLSNPDMDGLTNGARQTSVLFSIGCWPAAFDYDCLAEHFITNPTGGGVAFIGNSRYGWGSPGNPEYGYSDRYDRQFFAALLVDSLYQLGSALAKAKTYYVPHTRDENVYRWCQYEVNLLGDPEMPVWTDTPGQLTVQHPDTVPLGEGDYLITVTDAGTGQPVAGAMVCLRRKGDAYERGLTGPDGTILMTVAPSSGGLPALEITASAHNFLPVQDSIVVGGGGRLVDYAGYQIDDASLGNGDGALNPGESAALWLIVVNHGPGAAENLTGGLYSCGDAYVTLEDSALFFGSVPEGLQAMAQGGCAVSVDPACPDRHIALFDWALSDDDGYQYSGLLSVEIAGAHLSCYRFQIEDAGGDGAVDPGEQCILRLWTQNTGLATASQVSVELQTSDPMIGVTGSPAAAGDIPGGDYAPVEFSLNVDPLCGSQHVAALQAEFVSTAAPTDTDSIFVVVGPTGFCDDLENGTAGWTQGGSHSLWALTDHRCHSGQFSWYCGNPDTWTYPLNATSWLDLPAVVLAPDSRLTFWDWFSVPNYGVDGCHVIVTDISSGGVDTLDFIGTGGALDSALLTGNRWTQELYDLSAYPPGTNVSVRISFTSDGS
ncbi:MAG TPA: C25 family cysteine peptidase, partial [Acidobacteriota bacterium]|nr:C25 family cysteine peptidase [Acidobacteriota bacterium]